MIGKKELVIDMQTLFEKSVSSDANMADGSHSPETDAVNLLAEPGVMYAPAAHTDKSTNLVGNLIGHTPGDLAANGFFIDDQGYVYSVSSTQVLAASTQLAGTYSYGITDIIQFIDKIYISSTNDIARMNTDLSAGDATWWSSTLSKSTLSGTSPHPMVLFQDLLWFGDNNFLNNIVDSSTGNKHVLAFAANKQITALGVEPSNGMMLIATTTVPNFSNQFVYRNSIFTYDGTSATYTREYPVDGMVTAIITEQGVTYVFYGGNKMGYWTGNGVKFLRTLKNTLGQTGSEIPYKAHVIGLNETLYVIDGKQILAFGAVRAGGRPVFRYAYKNQLNTNKLSIVCSVGNGLLGIGIPTGGAGKFVTFDPVSKATMGGLTFYTNPYAFPRPVFIRGIYIEYADSIPNNDATREIAYQTENLVAGFFGMTAPNGSDDIFINKTGAAINFFYAETNSMLTDKVRLLQFLYQATTSQYGVRRIIVYYDPAE